jgi:hypothetical protein
MVGLLTLLTTGRSVEAQTPEAEQRFQFDTELTYNAQITAPDSYLDYQPGEAYTPHHKVMGYFQKLAEESDRVTLHKYGETYEGRGLYYAVITSSRNQSMIDQIRANNHRLANPDSLNDTAADLVMSEQPVTVWLSYNVHGNEASSSEAAMQTAYRLAAAQDGETEEMLRQTVTIIDPMLNADGRERYVQWYKTVRQHHLNTNADDLEHDEPWPGGRTNHYWFDLNRDWVWLVHPESRGRVAAYQQWMPQVHLDLHEQGFNSNYFTMPGTTPRNQLLPDEYDKWATAFGNGVINEFDKHGINYATREAFDFFYPGYGSSYPSTMGAIGMLAEQGGHSRGGRAVETEDGYILTLRQRIFDHYTNSMATIRTAMQNRQDLFGYFRTFFQPESKKTNTTAYFLPDNQQDYTPQVIEMLLKHGIQVHQAAENFQIRNAYSYWSGESRSRSFPKGTYVIKTDQPRHMMVNTLMQRQMQIEDSVMYDMATWNIPMAYGLRGAWTSDRLRMDLNKVEYAPAMNAGVEGLGSYAYVIPGDQRYLPNALADLWEREYRVRLATKSFSKNGETYPEGSLVILVGRNHDKKDRITADMNTISDQHQVRIVGFKTGRMDKGIDLASRDSEPLEQPQVGLLVDTPISSYSAGQIWFLFDRWTDFGIHRIRTGSLDRMELNKYQALIIPGSWGSLGEVIDSTQIERLKQWVRQGGTLIAAENSAAFMSKEVSGFTSVQTVTQWKKDKEEQTDQTINPTAYTRYEAREDSSGLKRIPGSAFQGIVDTSHPLAFGVDEQVYPLKLNEEGLVPNKNWQTVGYYAKNPKEVLASGYASKHNRQRLAGMAFAGVVPMGRGKVVLLMDNTQYRMFWVNTARMMQNAAMLMPSL